ncbi:hypothetical protein CWI42_110390 [Ordospora colligata]|uniref:Uncharacterized protein n=1 Tax=Ordospora colligata OC4 TaxID=1354746 RepID=A0A0B2UID9_9MICR|nr:uncharacterized protein M896_110390 [Ordospora colligata OC4]KHN69009.1 hypothetical protein M896_110390 [Ordospora colligata OC4]TBU14237.1 hypothetical protein CWI40_110390 [Ordospora colligata]TBU14284.1 hypothetical protein CWI41_110390 [Ordospora colligata]TBU17914.1 hypothetical protein CWI42_110390 [Ordospora colligata]
MLKDLIDEDEFCRKLRTASEDDAQDGFYIIFYKLLLDPSQQLLDSLLSSYPVQDVVNGLKHLIKFKFYRLTDDVSNNLISIVSMMLVYEDNVDTLIVNMLRLHLIEDVFSMYKAHPKYFTSHPVSLMFLMFFCAQSTIHRAFFDASDFQCSDFLFLQIKEMIEDQGSETYVNKRSKKNISKRNLDYPPFPFIDYFYSKGLLNVLFTATPFNMLSSQLSVELEMNIMFVLENVHNLNFDFYMNLLFKDYIRNETEACRVLRFIANIPCMLSIYNVVDSILRRYPSSFVALIYDLMFWNEKEKINQNLVDYLKIMDNRCILMINPLLDEWQSLKYAIDIIHKRHQPTKESIHRMIHGLGFDRYYEIVREMKRNNIPIIPIEMYDKIIKESFEWDGYAQVYLWKILGFQKIYFGLDVSDAGYKERSIEAKEGFEIVKSLCTLTQ